MAKNLGSKCKLCRRAKEKLFLKADRCDSPKCAVTRRNTTPGVHGKSMGKGLSEYGKQLAQKQKIKRIYGVSELQFRNHLSEAERQKGVVGDNLLMRLEQRMDNIIYRLGFAPSRPLARQLVSHSMFMVNGKNLNIPSAMIKVGDVIKIKEGKAKKTYFTNLQPILKNNPKTPSWLVLDPNNMEGKIMAKPNLDEMGMNLDAQVVVEFYSR